MRDYNDEPFEESIPDDFDEYERRRFDADQEAMYQASEANGKAEYPASDYEPGFEFFTPEMKDIMTRLRRAVEAHDNETIKAIHAEVKAVGDRRLAELAAEYDLEADALQDWYNRAFQDIGFILESYVRDNQLFAMMMRPFMFEFKSMIRAFAIYGYVQGKRELVDAN